MICQEVPTRESDLSDFLSHDPAIFVYLEEYFRYWGLTYAAHYRGRLFDGSRPFPDTAW